MLQCDFAYMISPQMFERFVLPDLTACCEALEHGFYHLDGKGQIRHLSQAEAEDLMQVLAAQDANLGNRHRFG